MSKIKHPARPFRLHDAKAQKFFAHRCYSHKLNAMRAALWIAKWLDIGNTVEVIDVRNMKLHGAYTRRVNHVQFDSETVTVLPKADRVPRPEAEKEAA